MVHLLRSSLEVSEAVPPASIMSGLNDAMRCLRCGRPLLRHEFTWSYVYPCASCNLRFEQQKPEYIILERKNYHDNQDPAQNT
jgi:DNA-directed RNA polymerase subunit RPC12/RpoP